jgi:hypothetical protein
LDHLIVVLQSSRDDLQEMLMEEQWGSCSNYFHLYLDDLKGRWKELEEVCCSLVQGIQSSLRLIGSHDGVEAQSLARESTADTAHQEER